jgi:1-deoxy-D-xylulose 5-phosphate reductoisomerase
LNFGDIPGVIASTMNKFGGGNLTDLASVLAADAEARAVTQEALGRNGVQVSGAGA